MSELINVQRERHGNRRRLLGTVSAVALLAWACDAGHAWAEDADHPTVWIELGGQLERSDGESGRFTAPFMVPSISPKVFDSVSPIDAQKAPRYGFGGEAKISFEPRGTDWVFWVGLRYGRANGNRELDHQSAIAPIKLKDLLTGGPKYLTPTLQDYSNNHVESSESHAILDFTAGKDVGLGMFGKDSSSVIGFGVRFAQFSSRMTADIHVRPDIVGSGVPPKYIFAQYNFHNYAFTGQSTRNFRGIGPVLSWDASAPFLGHPDSTEFTFDWGVNAALLFGRQKARVSHHTAGQHYHPDYSHPTPTPIGDITHYERLYDHATNKSRARFVAIPNLGGFAGVSMKFPNAKVSFGYRADFFFGAMDTGIDTRRSSDVSFHGPFAKISVGLGG